MKKFPPIVIKLTNHRDALSRRLKNPAFKRAYDSLETEFAIYGAMIDARAKRGMTQARLAKKVGTKQSAIARFESGRSNPTWEFMQKLTNALDLDIKVVPRH